MRVKPPPTAPPKMSMTVDQLLKDAKELSTRMQVHDNFADQLLGNAEGLEKQIDGMKQYNEEVIARRTTDSPVANRSVLLYSLIKENRFIKQLQQENKDLKNCVEEHQQALQIIMQKYRVQMQRLIQQTQIDRKTLDRRIQYFNNKLENHVLRINEMAEIMHKAAADDSETEMIEKLREENEALRTTNTGLRELMGINHSVGEDACRLSLALYNQSHSSEIACQTDVPLPCQDPPPPPEPASDNLLGDSPSILEDSRSDTSLNATPPPHQVTVIERTPPPGSPTPSNKSENGEDEDDKLESTA